MEFTKCEVCGGVKMSVKLWFGNVPEMHQTQFRTNQPTAEFVDLFALRQGAAMGPLTAIIPAAKDRPSGLIPIPGACRM